MRPLPRWKVVAFALAPAVVLIWLAEGVVRVKYFIAHDYDWRYLTAGIRAVSGPSEVPIPVAVAEEAPTSTVPNGSGAAPSPASAVVFSWSKPCVDEMVYSEERRASMPRTWNEHCLRGDAVAMGKADDEFRIMFVGGSTVEDALADEEMMTNRFKAFLPPLRNGRRITVINAGRVGYESRRIRMYWTGWLHRFSPDLLMYYEGWNEQPTDVRWTAVDTRIAAVRSRLHKALYYRSLLYTYLLERFAFTTTADRRFWRSDLESLRENFTILAADARSRGTRMVFVTQIVQFPRFWKGVDTFDPDAVLGLLDRLRADAGYPYDAVEISALNQRLVVQSTIRLCRELGIPVIDILDEVEALGEERRSQLFVDLGHLSAAGTRTVGRLVAEAAVAQALIPASAR